MYDIVYIHYMIRIESSFEIVHKGQQQSSIGWDNGLVPIGDTLLSESNCSLETNVYLNRQQLVNLLRPSDAYMRW